MTGDDGFTAPCSSDAPDGGNVSATTKLSYADALAKTASEIVKAIVRKRRILFAGFVCMGEERLPQRG